MTPALYSFLLTLPLAAMPDGSVTLPVEAWNQMQHDLDRAARPEQPQIAVSSIERSIDGRFQKGLLSATLKARFEVLTSEVGHIRVPVLDGAASIGEVSLDGRQTSLARDGRMYTVGVDRPGIHEVRLQFYSGEEQDSFTRRLRFRLPEGGSTVVSVLLPERDIEAKLANGAIESARQVGNTTLLRGYLDASGSFDLAWSRKPSHERARAVRSEIRANILFTLGEALVRGMAVFDFQILEGEADRFDLRLPEGIEVLRVEGDAVLQWQTDSGAEGSGGRLIVLLRYLVDKEARAVVHFQLPVESLAKPVALRMPLAAEDTPMTGNLGIQGPAGLNVQVAPGLAKAKELTLRDLPPDLIELTTNPLLLGFTFTEPPEVALQISRHQELTLTTTIIDDLQASTVMIEDGSQITKLKLRVRNNTRQYLSLRLPEGAKLTHSLVDGNPVRPALKQSGALLFPLRQSERLGAGGARFHYVREGETLSDIANFYYSDPNAWRRILEANANDIYSPSDVAPGQRLRIPLDAQVEESSFVIELAYREQKDPLGTLGRRQIELPEVDVDTTKVTWHLYFPSSLAPLSFDTNLTQYSAIRYDPFRRVRDFIRRALVMDDAWAGGRYRSILKQRKEIYHQEAQKKAGGAVVLASFPLVGERYRFKRKLSGHATPTITVTWVAAGLGASGRWLAFFVALALTVIVLRRPEQRQRWAIAAVGLVVLLVLAHYFLGLHRRILWGVDVALLAAWGRLRLPAWWRWLAARVKEPWLWFSWLRLGNLLALIGLCVLIGILVNVPMLLSSIICLLLVIAHVRLRRREASHA